MSQSCRCPADLDGDRDVGFEDVLAALAAWGNEGGPEDLDGNGVVDFGDLVILLAAWGPCDPVGACCLPDGTCAEVMWVACVNADGFYQGDATTCGAGACQPADDCVDAPVVGDGSYAYSTRGANQDAPPFLPEECDEGNGIRLFHGVWMRYIAACDGVATASVCASDFDTRLAVYETDAETCYGTLVACNDDACGEGGTRSEVSFPVSAGEVYLIRIGGPFLDGGGDGVLAVKCQ